MTRWYPMLLVLALVALACSGGEDADEPASTTNPVETTAAATTDPPTPDDGDAASPQPAALQSVDGLTLRIVDGWSATVVGEGVKPVLAIDPSDEPGIAYLLEDRQGFIAYADAAGDWSTDTVVEGYFYGPIGLAYTSDGTPHIAFHDHQEIDFLPELGDLTVASRNADAWDIEAIEDEGHDGWDSTIVTGPGDVVFAAGIDPQQFDRPSGVEFFERTDSGWLVEEIGSGPIAYEFNVGLAVGADGEPGLSYYDNNTQTLQYATRAGGSWTIETVDDSADVGRYSSLAYDSTGVPHITYVELTGATTAIVRHATNDGSGWVIEDVTGLDAILPGFTGARRVTHVVVDSADQPHVVYGDEAHVGYATRGADGWETTTIAEAGDLRLGQLVTFALDADDSPHIAIFEVTNSNPLDGVIAYLTTG